MTDDVRTEYLGQFDELEAQVIVDILADHGIYAVPKLALTETENNVYPGVSHEHGALLVEAGRAAEARAIIERELPAHLAAIAASMREIEQGIEAPLEES